MKAKRIELKASSVEFLPEPHEYWYGEKQLSGITELIQRQLFKMEYEGIPEWIIKQAGAYGTDVHQRIELFDKEWQNDGTQEVEDYIRLCQENNFVHEMSEYTVTSVTDGLDYASNIDKVYRISDDTFTLADIKTYGRMDAQKLAKAQWQLSIYRYMFLLLNPGAKVDRLVVIRLRNKTTKSGKLDHAAEVKIVEPIPVDICKELLKAESEGRQFLNPYDIPAECACKEDRIRELLEQKDAIDEELSGIKTTFLDMMTKLNVMSWVGNRGTKFTRKLPTTRSSFNLQLFKEDHKDIDYSKYMKTSNVSGSLSIAI